MRGCEATGKFTQANWRTIICSDGTSHGILDYQPSPSNSLVFFQSFALHPGNIPMFGALNLR